MANRRPAPITAMENCLARNLRSCKVILNMPTPCCHSEATSHRHGLRRETRRRVARAARHVAFTPPSTGAAGFSMSSIPSGSPSTLTEPSTTSTSTRDPASGIPSTRSGPISGGTIGANQVLP